MGSSRSPGTKLIRSHLQYNVETIIRDHHKASVVEEKNKDVKMWQGNKPEEGQYDFAADVTMEDGQIRE